MTYFLCKMVLPRSDFLQTMTDSEKNIMKAHGDYLQSLAEVGSIVCHGPVDDPKGGWVLSIFSAKDQTEVERLTAADPIILDDVGARYEILPMKQLRMMGAELSKPSAAAVPCKRTKRSFLAGQYSNPLRVISSMPMKSGRAASRPRSPPRCAAAAIWR